MNASSPEKFPLLQRKCCSANLKYSGHVTQIFFPACDLTWGPGDWPFLVLLDLDGLSPSEFCDSETCTALLPRVWSLSSLWCLPCCLEAFLRSSARPFLPFAVLLSQKSSSVGQASASFIWENPLDRRLLPALPRACVMIHTWSTHFTVGEN